MSRGSWPIRLASIWFVPVGLGLIWRSPIRLVRLRPVRFRPIGCIGSWRNWIRRSPIWFVAIWFIAVRRRMWLHSRFRSHHRSRANTLIRLNRLRCGKHRRPALVRRGKLRAVLRCILSQFHLRPHRRCVGSAVRRYFSPRWTHIHSVRPAVIAHPVVDHRLIDDGHIAFIHIGDMHVANVIDRAVVGKVIAAPVAALVTDAHIAKAIVDAAIKADIATPVSMMEAVAPSAVIPVSGRPERSLIGWLRPCTWHPVVAA